MPARPSALALVAAFATSLAPALVHAAESAPQAASARAPHLVREPLRTTREVRVALAPLQEKSGKEPAADRLSSSDAKFAAKKPTEVKLGCRLRGR